MQDGALCHRAKSLKDFSNINNVPPLSWPRNPYNMNPLENLQELLKKELDKEIISTKTMLIEKIIKMWNNNQEMKEEKGTVMHRSHG